MIEGLFSQPNYLMAKKSLDAIELRHTAIASNIANLETPGYKRVDLAPSFSAELQRAFASGDSQQLAGLKPQIAVDSTALPLSRDGNTVSLENELLQLNKNSLSHALETQLVTGALLRLRLAITGKS